VIHFAFYLIVFFYLVVGKLAFPAFFMESALGKMQDVPMRGNKRC